MQKFISKIYRSPFWWVALLLGFLAVVYATVNLRFRADLTAEKRFSLNHSTDSLLSQIDSIVNIQVFLTGELPADYKKLSLATKDLLDEFRDLSGNQVQIEYMEPGKDLADSLKYELYDSLARLGVVFEEAENLAQQDDKTTRQLIIPSALVSYKNQQPIAVDLRSSRTVFKNFNVINDVPQPDKEATMNSAEALLEYKFINAIYKLTRTYVPAIGYAVGNGEPIDLTVNDLGENLRNQYRLGIFNLKQAYPDPELIDALLIVKPTQPFTDEDKLKLDQYVMHGGKIVWFIDKLYAELDSLMRSQADFVAYDRNLNLDDILFRYGVRINGDLLQDLNCSKIPLVYDYNPDGSPKIQRFPWPYYPFLSTSNNNPISKNLDRVLSIFPSSIDTVKAPGIEKTILLSSDTNSRRLSAPAIVSINKIREEISEQNFSSYNNSYVPVAVLLHGKFTSLYANRLTPALRDSVKSALKKDFLPVAQKPTQQVVVSDADIVLNAVSNTSGPLPMGQLPLENYRFANREFFLNTIDYLVSDNGIFAARNKDFTLRLLDKKKLVEQKLIWQLINIVVPVALIIIFGIIYQWRRKSRYSVRS